MKTLLGLLFTLSLVACSTRNSGKTYEEWKELQSFHLVMAEAFHPYKDSANLAPAKALAKGMADEATKWASATLPERVDNQEMKDKLQSLNNGSQAFLKIVNESAPDSVVAQSLTELHNLFHKIQEGWYGAGKKDDQKDHH